MSCGRGAAPLPPRRPLWRVCSRGARASRAPAGLGAPAAPLPASPAVHARRPLPYPSSRRPFLTHPGLKNRLVTAQIPKGQNGRRVLARPGSTEYCLRLPDGKKVRAPHGFTAGSETSKSNTNHGLSYFRNNTNTNVTIYGIILFGCGYVERETSAGVSRSRKTHALNAAESSQRPPVTEGAEDPGAGTVRTLCLGCHHICSPGLVSQGSVFPPLPRLSISIFTDHPRSTRTVHKLGRVLCPSLLSLTPQCLSRSSSKPHVTVFTSSTLFQVPCWSAQAATTKCCRLGGLNSNRILLMVLEAGKPKVKVPVSLIPGVSPSWLADGHLLLIGEREREIWGLFFFL